MLVVDSASSFSSTLALAKYALFVGLVWQARECTDGSDAGLSLENNGSL